MHIKTLLWNTVEDSFQARTTNTTTTTSSSQNLRRCSSLLSRRSWGSWRLLYFLLFPTSRRRSFHPSPSIRYLPLYSIHRPCTKNLCNPVLVAPGCKNVATFAATVVCIAAASDADPRHHRRQLVNQMQRSHREVNCSESQLAFESTPEGLWVSLRWWLLLPNWVYRVLSSWDNINRNFRLIERLIDLVLVDFPFISSTFSFSWHSLSVYIYIYI